MFERVKFLGDELTRGQYGESIQFGRMDSEGYIYVWDSTYGWFLYGHFDSGLWELTGEKVNDVNDDF